MFLQSCNNTSADSNEGVCQLCMVLLKKQLTEAKRKISKSTASRDASHCDFCYSQCGHAEQKGELALSSYTEGEIALNYRMLKA